jgi:hypothetical protein
VKLFARCQRFTLGLIRVWWRPIACVGIAGGAFVNLLLLPLKTSQPADLEKGAAYVTACAAAFLVREVGKKWGTAQ